MIPSSNSPVKGSGTPNRYDGDLLHTMRISRLSRVSVWACGPLNLMKITPSAAHVRAGQRRSHPRHWQVLARLVSVAPSGADPFACFISGYAAIMCVLTAYRTRSALLLAPSTAIMRYL
jgi:hypothetical protein